MKILMHWKDHINNSGTVSATHNALNVVGGIVEAALAVNVDHQGTVGEEGEDGDGEDVQSDEAVEPAAEVVPVGHAVHPADAASTVAPLLSSGVP